MKNLVGFLIAIMSTTGIPAIAATATQPLDATTLARVEQVINRLKDDPRNTELVSEALNIRKMDLLRVCFENYYTRKQFVLQSSLINDSIFRDELVVMMLKSGQEVWSVDDDFMTRPAPFSLMVEPFISTVKERLPNSNLANIDPKNRESRLKLAADIEAEIAKSKAAALILQKQEETTLQQKQQQATTATQPKVSTTPRDYIESPSAQHQTPTTPSDKPISSVPWSIIVGSIVAALGVLWFFLKGRK
jgi:hypothetical protein